MARSSAFSAGFDEGAFRDAIHNTMLMGMPENVAERLTFWWNRDQTYTPDDPAGDPYDWTSTPVTDHPGNPTLPDVGGEQSLSVPYALEFSARPSGSSATVFGDIDASRAVVTMLETNYDKIRTADYATVGNTRYRILYSGPPLGLFGVTVHQVFLEAEDSS
jgi:hypothetical protein